MPRGVADDASTALAPAVSAAHIPTRDRRAFFPWFDA
jgi:hypothetical protein